MAQSKHRELCHLCNSNKIKGNILPNSVFFANMTSLLATRLIQFYPHKRDWLIFSRSKPANQFPLELSKDLRSSPKNIGIPTMSLCQMTQWTNLKKKNIRYDFPKYEYCYLDYMKDGITPKKQESYMVDSPIKKRNCIFWREKKKKSEISHCYMQLNETFWAQTWLTYNFIIYEHMTSVWSLNYYCKVIFFNTKKKF